MSDWDFATVAEVADKVGMGPFGSSIRVSTFVQSGIPVISGQHLRGPRLHDGEYNFVSKAHADRLKNAGVFRGDVVLTHAGSIGQVAYIPETSRYQRYILSQRQFYVRCDPTKMNPKFLTYYLRSPMGQHALLANASQTGVPSISRPVTYIRTLQVPVPPLAEQLAVADLLCSLDDKIESNVRLAMMVRESAKAVVQTAEPVGRLVRVGDIAEVRRGLSYKGSGLAKQGMRMANMGNAATFGWLKREGFKHYTGEYKAKHVAKGGSLLVVNTEQTWRQEIIGWPMILPVDVPEALFSHHVFLVDFQPAWAWARLALWAHLYTPAARAFIDGRVYGTTVATLPPSAISEITFPVPLPDSDAIASADLLLRRAWAAEVESRSLAAIRDVLLPELLSGRLRVPEGREQARAFV